MSNDAHSWLVKSTRRFGSGALLTFLWVMEPAHVNAMNAFHDWRAARTVRSSLHQASQAKGISFRTSWYYVQGGVTAGSKYLARLPRTESYTHCDRRVNRPSPDRLEFLSYYWHSGRRCPDARLCKSFGGNSSSLGPRDWAWRGPGRSNQ